MLALNTRVYYKYFILKSVTSSGSMKKTPKQHQADVNSENNSIESSPATTPVHLLKNDNLSSAMPNSFNSIDLQSPTNRNLSEKEMRDCDVIGTNLCLSFITISIINLT